jgi:hypothetical protein
MSINGRPIGDPPRCFQCSARIGTDTEPFNLTDEPGWEALCQACFLKFCQWTSHDNTRVTFPITRDNLLQHASFKNCIIDGVRVDDDEIKKQ